MARAARLVAQAGHFLVGAELFRRGITGFFPLTPSWSSVLAACIGLGYCPTGRILVAKRLSKMSTNSLYLLPPATTAAAVAACCKYFDLLPDNVSSALLVTAGTGLMVGSFVFSHPQHFERGNPWRLTPEPHPDVALRKAGEEAPIGVLLCNLGTPTAPTPKAVGVFLKEFLMDRRVVEIHPAVWWPILNWFVVPRRKHSSSELYTHLFQDGESPLLKYALRHATLVQERLGSRFYVQAAMRVGPPNIRERVEDMRARGIDKIVALSMYPQYSGTTSASIYDGVYEAVLRYRHVPAVRMAAPYATHPLYINAVAKVAGDYLASVRRALDAKGERISKYVFSFHGIPIANVKGGDPYPSECEGTTAALIKAMGLNPEECIMTYQSQFGRDPWLRPATDEYLEATAKEHKASGVKDPLNIFVVCPGFTKDCLETIDEIGRVSSAMFAEACGGQLFLAPCLNASPEWVDACAQMVINESVGWAKPL